MNDLPVSYGTLRIGEAIASVRELWLEDGQIKIRATFPISAKNEAGPVTLFDPHGRQVASGQRVSLSDHCREINLVSFDSIVVTWELTVESVGTERMHRVV